MHVSNLLENSESYRKKVNLLTIIRPPLVILVGIFLTGILAAKIGNIWSIDWFVVIGAIGFYSMYADHLIRTKKNSLEELYLSSVKEERVWETFHNKLKLADFETEKFLKQNGENIEIQDLILMEKLDNMIGSFIDIELHRTRTEKWKF